MRFRRPEKEYSCTAASLRNCLLYKGYNYTEKEIRKIINTKKVGTYFDDLIKGLETLKFKPALIIRFNKKQFKDCLDKELLEKKTVILVTDSDMHTVAVLKKERGKYKIIDNMFDIIEQNLTFNQLEGLANWFNREIKKIQYHFVSF